MMNEFITSYLIQRRECALPGLGTFSLTTEPARYDVAAKEMLAPKTKVAFSENADEWSSDFIMYVSEISKTTTDTVIANLQKWVEDAREEINSEREVILATLGSLRIQNETLEFVNVQHERLFRNLKAERAVHKEAKHTVIVGDKESTNTEMNEFLSNSTVKTGRGNRFWKIAAAVLLLIGVGVLAYHFYNHNSFGNQTPVKAGYPPNTYITR